MAKAAAEKLKKANKPMTMLEQINAQREQMKAKAEAQAAKAAEAGGLKAPEEKVAAKAVSPRAML